MRAIVLALLLFVGCTVAGDRLDGISDGDHCTSGVKDRDESDIDCGGADCVKCPPEASCKSNADCNTGVCANTEGPLLCECPPDMTSHIRPEDGRIFCIDKREVSVGQYDAFLKSCPAPGCPSDCDGPWTVTIPVDDDPSVACTPDKYDLNFPNRPVVCVHFCDALAYCYAQDKRLCGNYLDDALPASSLANPNESEWFNACSPSGAPYPYAGDYNSTYCNGASTSSVDVGTLSQCGTGNDLRDMSGNVWEWEAAYDDAEDACIARGGSFRSNDDQELLKCSSRLLVDCEGYADDIGFRCCSG